MITKEHVLEVIKTYEEAWREQNCDKILSIFTEEGIYHEYLLKEANHGHNEIRAYWQRKVLEEQSNINFELLNVFIDGNTAIAEWDASFDSNVKNCHIHIREIAVLEFEETGEKIKFLREYWHSEKFPLQ